MVSQNNPKGRENGIVVQELGKEVLLYDLNNNKAFCLNPTSAAIWNLCDGNTSVSDITKQLSKQVKQPVTNDLVYLALDQFKTDNLLEDSELIEIKFDGLSRREAIRKVGFASMIALPVIASIVAPTAAMAQSVAVAPACAPLTDPGSINCDNCARGTPCSNNLGTCNGAAGGPLACFNRAP